MTAIVIVGAGHAGVQAAVSLRDDGFTGAITLLSAEADFPYQRPPLSKAFLKGQSDLAGLPLKAAQFFEDHRIDVALGVAVTRIDCAAQRVTLSTGGKAPYDHLILATGARARALRAPGLHLAGVHVLRTIHDAARLKQRLATARRLVVVGAGFIGLEVAATACALGLSVTVVEIADRPMGRAVSPATSSFFDAAHRAFGVDFRFGVGVAALHGGTSVSEVELSDGARVPADLVLVGVGVVAEDALASAAGIACSDGVLVDETLLSSEPHVSAIGDCARFTYEGARTRLESVQNAADQAKCVASRLMGKPQPYAALPWFWSDQGDLKLQIAGLSRDVDRWVARGGVDRRALTVFGFAGDRLKAVETVNRGADHMSARRLLAAQTPLTPDQAADENLDLRKLALAR